MIRPSTDRAPTRSPFATTTRYLRILYVDDASALRDIARLSFDRLGHTMECVADSIMAVGTFTARPAYDLVIAEHNLPHLNGLGLAMRLREGGYAGKFIILADDVDRATEDEYLRLNVDRIMLKPVLPSGLRACVAELFPGSGRL
jgi:CheY-like chemotaxis protein